MSDADVESYKQIKSDLDVLRQSVEKSELWVYKSNKPTAATVAAGSSQQLHNDSDELQQQTSVSSITQIPMTTADAISSQATSSANANEITPQPITVEGTQATTTATTINTDKLSYDASATDGGGDGVDVDEDDEYKKIQKVIVMY